VPGRDAKVFVLAPLKELACTRATKSGTKSERDRSHDISKHSLEVYLFTLLRHFHAAAILKNKTTDFTGTASY
jgi:hypothetical protein